jgi:hypothetical protein
MKYYRINVCPLVTVCSVCWPQQQYFTSREDATACVEAIREYFYGDVLEGSTLSGSLAEFILCRGLTVPTRCTVYALASTDDSVSAVHIKDYVEEAVREVEGLEAAHVDVTEYNTDIDFYAAYDIIPSAHIFAHFDYEAVPD